MLITNQEGTWLRSDRTDLEQRQRLAGAGRTFPIPKCRDGLTSRQPLGIAQPLSTAISVRRANLAALVFGEGRRATRAAPDRRTSRVTFGSAGRGRPTSDGADALRFWDGLRELRRQRREAVADGRNAGRCDGRCRFCFAKISYAPVWIIPAIEALLLVALVIADPGRIDRRSDLIRALSLGLVAILVVGPLQPRFD